MTLRNIRFGCFVLLGLAQSSFGQVDQSIYADSLLNGWQNYGWATLNYSNPSPVHSGTASISVNATAYQALYLHHEAFDTGLYTNLTFWIHRGSTGGPLLKVQALL